MKEKEKCIFCEIAKGNLEPLGGAKIFEDENYLAFLSPFPNTEGFTILISKEHFGGDVLAMPNEELKDFVIVAKKVSQMLLNYFEDVGRVGLIMEGTGVDHAHIKLFPMHKTENLKRGELKKYKVGVDKYFEEYEGYISSYDGVQADFSKLQKLAEGIRGENKI